MHIAILSLTFLSSYMLSAMGEYLLSGSVLILLSLYLYACYYRRSGCLVLCPAGLFSLSWVGGAGVSALKLSNLQTDWEPLTWLSIWLFAAAFLLAYELLTWKIPDTAGTASAGKCSVSGEQEAMFTALVIYITAAVCMGAFLIEAWLLGYIPLFTVDTPHAYSYFHITGLHYFTTSFVLIPAEAAVYFMLGRRKRRRDIAVAVCTVIGLLLPVLLVSRFQMILSVLLCIFTIIMIRRDSIGSLLEGRRKYLLGGACVGALVLYVFLTIERAHSVEYLKSIFDMKDDGLPIWIIQPYMYVANNFDNLNCLIRDLPVHSGGLRMLYPVLVFTGLKFLKPELTAFPIYVTKEELTTLTMVYDAWYDFGTVGVLAFGLMLGAVMGLLERRVMRRESGCRYKLWYVTMAQPVFYMSLTFFTTWYSNPSTWFYLGVSALSYAFLCVCMSMYERRRAEKPVSAADMPSGQTDEQD